MERESVAYFYLQKNRVAKRNFYSKTELNEFCVERQDRLVIKAIGIPEYYAESFVTELAGLWNSKILHCIPKRRKKKEIKRMSGEALKKNRQKKRNRVSWEKEKLVQLLCEEFARSGAEYFFYGEETAAFLEKEMPQVPLFFMEEMLLQYGIRENMILIGNQNPFFESIFANFMQRVNFLKIVCDREEEYEEAMEWLYENYGIVTVVEAKRNVVGRESILQEKSVQREMTFREREVGREKQVEGERIQSVGKRRFETLVIDMEPGGRNGKPQIDLPGLPEGTVYMDMCSEREKARWITKKRKDIHYLSPESLLNKWCHLDTTAQNGYNTRVKLEVL